MSYHVNGGPIAMPDSDFGRLVQESDIAMQVCTAGNLRTALLVAQLLAKADQYERLLIATDTPTGSGIMPLGMLYTIELIWLPWAMLHPSSRLQWRPEITRAPIV